MREKVDLKWLIAGIVLTVAAAIAIPVIIREITRTVYKNGSKVTEEDFEKSRPVVVKKSGENAYET